jgi:hypothetical protein
MEHRRLLSELRGVKKENQKIIDLYVKKIFSKTFILNHLHSTLRGSGDWMDWVAAHFVPSFIMGKDYAHYMEAVNEYWSVEEEVKILRQKLKHLTERMKETDDGIAAVKNQIASTLSLHENFFKQTIEPQKFIVQLKQKAIQDDRQLRDKICSETIQISGVISRMNSRIRILRLQANESRVMYDKIGEKLLDIMKLVEREDVKFFSHHLIYVDNHITELKAKLDSVNMRMETSASRMNELENEMKNTTQYKAAEHRKMDEERLAILRGESMEAIKVISRLKDEMVQLEQSKISAADACKKYSSRDHRRHVRDLEYTKRELTKLTESISAVKAIVADLEKDRDRLTDGSVELRELYDLREKFWRDLQDANILLENLITKQGANIREYTDIVSATNRLNSDLEQSRKRLAQITGIELPKLNEELELKDELILKIINKKIENNEKRIQQFPFLAPNDTLFMEWNSTLSVVDQSVAVQRELLKNLESIDDTINPNITQFYLEHNKWSKESERLFIPLNKTYYNLTEYEDKLIASVNKSRELLERFKSLEIEYFEKEKIYGEYSKKVEAGLIPKIDFVFEY